MVVTGSYGEKHTSEPLKITTHCLDLKFCTVWALNLSLIPYLITIHT